MFIVVVFFAGLLIGVGLFFWRTRKLAHERRRVPRKWPLIVRPIVNSEEKRVLVWLRRVMFDQQVMVKLPFTRFTAPAKRDEATHWFELLNSLYCTFTVCSMEGRVIACFDVPGPLGSKKNQNLKQTLLSQCGIRYCVVDSIKLPHPSQVRFEFFGQEVVKKTDQAVFDASFKDVRQSLQAALDRQRNHKKQSAGQSNSDFANSSGFEESRTRSDWAQNSFITPLDSRFTEIRSL
jgi:hypothetical protein